MTTTELCDSIAAEVAREMETKQRATPKQRPAGTRRTAEVDTLNIAGALLLAARIQPAVASDAKRAFGLRKITHFLQYEIHRAKLRLQQCRRFVGYISLRN